MPQFYKVNHRKLSFGEYWNISPNWKGVVAWLMKVFGHPIREDNAYPDPSGVKEYEVTENQLPAEAVAALANARKHFEELGFHSPKWMHQPPLHAIVSMVAGTYAHNSGEVIGRLIHTKAVSGTMTIEQLAIALLTPLKDGRVMVTTNMRPSFRGPRNIIVERRVGASPAVLYELHMKRLKRLPAGAEIRKFQTVEECEKFAGEYEQEGFEFNLRRGLYVMLTEDDMAQKRTEEAATEAALAEGQRYPKVFAEIERIQNKKTSWTSTLLILAISIAAFVALGVFRWSWETVAILVGVLFFHEMGHYVAMRAFNYQNLRMFFIPLFGAAVSGRNYNVKGWQKAIVSLAGPVPGIIVGGALGLFAIFADQQWASKIAMMALLLNGINLLPILPLDGGWLMHTLVFCRRYWLEGAFHLLAGLMMIGYKIGGGETIFLVLGILMLFTSPMAFRLARVAHRLRTRGISGVSYDQQTIPQETGEAIIDEIKASIPGAHSNKTLGSLTLSVFEKLNAIPPSLGASILLFIAHVAPMAFAVLFGATLVVARPGLRSTPSFTHTPVVANREYACNTTQRAGDNTIVPSVVFISTYDTKAEAEKVFREMPKETTVTFFGQTLFYAAGENPKLPTNDQTVAEYPTSNHIATVVLTCAAASEADAIALRNELNAYLDLTPAFLLVPPWIPQPELSNEDKARQERARDTYRQIQKIRSAAYRQPEYTELSKQLLSRFRRKKSSEHEKLLKQMQNVAQEYSRQKLLELKARGEEVDVTLIDLHLRQPDSTVPGDAYPDWWNSVAERLGQHAKDETGLPASTAGWFAVRYGQVKRSGVNLRFEHLSFRRTDLGLPALADFLCSRSCSEIRYQIIDSGPEDY